jgi:sortase B
MENKLKKSSFIIIILALAVILGAAIFLVWYTNGGSFNANIQDFTTPPSTQAIYNENQYATNVITLPDGVKKPAQPNPYDFEKFAKTNTDIYAVLVVPGAGVEQPVAQSAENEPEDFYLDHDINKNYLFEGTVYSQKINSKNFTDPITVLYGHNMINGNMFGDLHKFEDKAFFDKNKEFYIYTDGHKLTYQIYAATDYSNKHLLYEYNIKNPASVQSFFDASLKSSMYNSFVRKGITLTAQTGYTGTAELLTTVPGDKVVVLSTCSNSSNDRRYLVQGVLISDEITG